MTELRRSSRVRQSAKHSSTYYEADEKTSLFAAPDVRPRKWRTAEVSAGYFTVKKWVPKDQQHLTADLHGGLTDPAEIAAAKLANRAGNKTSSRFKTRGRIGTVGVRVSSSSSTSRRASFVNDNSNTNNNLGAGAGPWGGSGSGGGSGGGNAKGAGLSQAASPPPPPPTPTPPVPTTAAASPPPTVVAADAGIAGRAPLLSSSSGKAGGGDDTSRTAVAPPDDPSRCSSGGSGDSGGAGGGGDGASAAAAGVGGASGADGGAGDGDGIPRAGEKRPASAMEQRPDDDTVEPPLQSRRISNESGEAHRQEKRTEQPRTTATATTTTTGDHQKSLPQLKSHRSPAGTDEQPRRENNLQSVPERARAQHQHRQRELAESNGLPGANEGAAVGAAGAQGAKAAKVKANANAEGAEKGGVWGAAAVEKQSAIAVQPA